MEPERRRDINIESNDGADIDCLYLIYVTYLVTNGISR